MSNQETVQLLIKAPWILPVIPQNRIFENCAIAVNGGKIVAILPENEAIKRFNPKQTIHLEHHILMPGLINAHGHAAMTLLRGYADDLSLEPWLTEHIWPAESRWLDADFVRDGTELAIAEMIKTGTTCYSDMYFFPEAAAPVIQKSSIRAQITFPILDIATNWAQDAEECFSKGLALHDEYRNDDLITVGFGPHAPYTVSDGVLSKVATLAQELDAPIQIHLHETAHEIEESLKLHEQRPSERLFNLGLMTPATQCVHMTQINDLDIELLIKSGAHVIHCPESNLKLASGFCPIAKLSNHGINVALGTDGAASNNDLDLFGELQTAALMGKAIAEDPAACSAHEMLAMATINGARALGIEDLTGSLEPGKAADIIAISLDELSSIPIHNPASTLVYSNRRTPVTHSWVNGRALLLSGHLQTLNEQDIKTRATHWFKKMSDSNTTNR